MNQKTAWLAGAIVAFVLVAFGAVAATLLKPASVAETAQTAAAPAAPQPQQNIRTQISTPQALAVVRKADPKARLNAGAELVNYEGVVAYEVATNTGKYYVDAQSGRLLAKPAPVINRPAPRQMYAENRYKRDHDDDDHRKKHHHDDDDDEEDDDG